MKFKQILLDEIKRKASFLSESQKDELNKRLEQNGEREGEDMTKPSVVQETPLTNSQRRIWFHTQACPDSSIYNIPLFYRIRGRLDITVLQRCLEKAIVRHEMLRSRVVVNGEEAAFVIDPPGFQMLHEWDYEATRALNPDIDLRDIIKKEIKISFDLLHANPIRIRCIRLGKDDYVLMITVHHIIFDEWSGQVLLNDLWKWYQSSFSEPLSLNETPDDSFRRYARKELSNLRTDKHERGLIFWRKELEHLPPAFQLPLYDGAPAKEQFQGGRHHFELGQTLSETVGTSAERLGVTPFIVLLTAFQLLLYRYTDFEDIIIGTPVANRVDSSNLETIGCFINTLPLRTFVSPGDSFASLVAQVKETVYRCIENQHIPFNEIVEAVAPAREYGRHPIYQCLFVFREPEKKFKNLPDIEISPIEVDCGSSIFDFTLIVNMDADILCTLAYNAEKYPLSLAKRMTNNLKAILAESLEHSSQPLCNLKLLDGGEFSQMCFDYNETSVTWTDNRTLPEIIKSNALIRPDSIAAYCGREMISYGDLDRRSSLLSSMLIGKGVRTETPVGVYLEKSINSIVAALAIWRCGGTYVPLDTASPGQRNRNILLNGNIRHLIGEERAFKIIGYEGDLYIHDPSVTEHGHCPLSFAPIHGDNLAYIIYTSGSTGKPKGVMISHTALKNAIQSTIRRYKLDQKSRSFAGGSPAFDASITKFFSVLAAGGSLIIPLPNQESDLDETVDLLNAHRVSTYGDIPGKLELLNNRTDYLEKLKYVTLMSSGGDALWSNQIFNLRKGRNFMNIYGPTEATINSCSHSFQSEETFNSRIPIGTPIENYQLYVMDGNYRVMPKGAIGQLCISGIGLARGYYQSPPETADRFVPHPLIEGARLFLTGDRAARNEDNLLDIYGRNDAQVKIRGYRIELGEIEANIRMHPDVDNVKLICHNSGEEATLIAYIASTAKDITPAGIKLFLIHLLPQYMVPNYYVFLDVLPKSVSGKIKQSDFRIPEDIPKTLPHADPSCPLEAGLLKIWRNLLKRDSVSIDDNFFDLGGHSLKAMIAADQITRTLGTACRSGEIFRSPTIRSLARFLQSSVGQDCKYKTVSS